MNSTFGRISKKITTSRFSTFVLYAFLNPNRESYLLNEDFPIKINCLRGMLCCHLRDLSCSIQNDCHQNLQLATVPNISQMFRLLPETWMYLMSMAKVKFLSVIDPTKPHSVT